jgi:polyisoprenoid-binding protein YceI
MTAITENVANAQATKWGYDSSHAKVGFSISHFGISETEGKFTKFNGTVLSDKPDFSDAKIDFTDALKYPTITFKGKSFEAFGKNQYKLTGDFTMHGATKEIDLDVIYNGTVVDPFNNTKAGFKLSGVIDRTEYGLVWNGILAAGGILVGNKVSLDINIELIKI